MVLVHLTTGVRDLDIVANINKRIICASCGQLSLDPHLMSCGNVLCPKCLTSVSTRDNVCPCGTVCGHPFSFRNFELQVLNLMVRCPNFSDGCGALVPMRCVDAHLRKCKISQPLIRYSGYDIDVLKIVDNLADTVSVAIDLGYPLKFETVQPSSQRYQWTPETPPPQINLQRPNQASPLTIVASTEALLSCGTNAPEETSEANERVKLPLPEDESGPKQSSAEASQAETGIDPIIANAPASKSTGAQSQSTAQKSNSNSPTENAASKLKTHHRKMRENDTLYMDEGVLKLLESGVSGRTRGVQKSGVDSEKDAKKDNVDVQSGRASPTAGKPSEPILKKYSSIHDLKPFRIVIERIPDDIFRKHFSAEVDIAGRKEGTGESGQLMKKCKIGSCNRPRADGQSIHQAGEGREHFRTHNTCTKKAHPSSSSSLLQKGAKAAEDTHSCASEKIVAAKKIAKSSSVGDRTQQQQPKTSPSEAKSNASSESVAAVTADQSRIPVNDTVAEASVVQSEASTLSVSKSLDEIKDRKPPPQEQRSVGPPTARESLSQKQLQSPKGQICVMRPSPSDMSSTATLAGKTARTLPAKNSTGKNIGSQLFMEKSKKSAVISRKMKRKARSSDATLKRFASTTTPAVGSSSGPGEKFQDKPVANAIAKNLQTVVGAKKFTATKTESAGKNDETSRIPPVSFKIPRKSTAAVVATPDPSVLAGPGTVELPTENPQTMKDQRDSPSKKRPLLSCQYVQPVEEVERKRGRLEERRPAAHASHQGPPERRQSYSAAKNDYVFHPGLENSPKQEELRSTSMSIDSEPSSESDRLNAMNIPVIIPLEPQVAVKESISQPILQRLTVRPVLELGIFCKKIWNDHVPSDNSPNMKNKDERSSLSPPPPLLSQTRCSSSLSSSSAVLPKRNPFDVRCQQYTEPSQMTNPTLQTNVPWRDVGSTTLLRTDPRRCLDPRSGAAAAVVAAAVQRSAPSFAPGGYGTIIYQRGMRVYQAL